MKKLIIFTILSIACLFMLVACAGAEPTQTPAIEPIFIIDTPTLAPTCGVVQAEPTPVPGISSFIPPVSPADFSFGPTDAPVTIIEYCDFQSSGCAGFARVISEIMKNHDDVRFILRPFPLTGITDKAEQAVLAALAADEQGLFWVMYDLLFVKYTEWANLKPNEFNDWVVRESSEVGLDGNRLRAAMNAPETRTRMTSMYEAAKKLGIQAVPLVSVNGVLQPSYAIDYENMNTTVSLIALGQKQFTSCPAYNIDPAKQYIATIHTGKGDIVLELFPNKAPLAVNSFVFLARQGWFDGVTFHRVITGFVAQAGDPSGTGMGNPGYFFDDEPNDLLFDKPGMVAMANSGPDTNGSQFFITFGPAQHLNGLHTIFGEVISGLNVAERLAPRDASSLGSILPPGDVIISVKIEEK